MKISVSDIRGNVPRFRWKVLHTNLETEGLTERTIYPSINKTANNKLLAAFSSVSTEP